jgi:ERCC4-related helicase
LVTTTVDVVVPEVAQVVRCRDRVWAVTSVQQSTLPVDPLAVRQSADHLVSLSSLEDDGFGDELQVIWEVEPGAEIIPNQSLPEPDLDHLDPPERLEAFLDAVRWGAVATADSGALQAPFRAGITIEDYQLDPVVRALSMPRANLLIADDVGLGKTIEAGLVVQELLLRHRAHSVIVVCPAGLCVKWQEEMRDRFGLEFRIVNTAAVRDLRRERGVGANVFSSFPRLIVSIDWLKDRRAQTLLDEVLAGEDHRRAPRKFDMLIVDEVHSAAPSGRGRYAVDSLRTKAIQRLAPHCEHRLFLSATPHNGYKESFTALLELLDPQRFARGVEPNPEQLARVLVRRLKRELREELPPNPDGSPRFPVREVISVPVVYTADDRKGHDLLERYAELRRGRHRSGSKRSAADFISLLLKKRLLSSPAAFANTVAQHGETMDRVGTASREASEMQMQVAWDRATDEAADDEKADATGEALATAARGQTPLSPQEDELLTELGRWADARRYQPDARAEAMLEWLTEVCRTPDGGWTDERVIIFTEYRDTQNWLYEQLLAQGFGGKEGDRLTELYGGMDTDTREHVKAEFQADPSRSPVRIMLATDAASEGIDLQRHCYRMLHWEIPWNPSRLEQRNGRVDRHGQPSPTVEIRHFVPEGWEDDQSQFATELKFLSLVAHKVEQIRDDLGSVGAVLSDQVGDAMLGELRAIDDDAVDRARSRPATKVLQVERKLREGLARCHERLQASISDLHLSPERVERVVATALELAHQPSLEDGTEEGTFWLPALSGSWQRTSEGMADRLSGEPMPFTFDGEQARGRDDVVLAHLGHRLVAQSLRLLRAEVWATGEARNLARVTARSVPVHPDLVEAGDIGVVCHARLVITGSDGHRLHEELVVAGGRIRGGRFSRIDAQRDLATLIDAAGEAASTADLAAAVASWERVGEPGVQRALERRAEDVQDSKQRELQRRLEVEADAVRAVLTDLQNQITAELSDLERERAEQLSLFDAPEADQSQRDLDALSRRVEEIPDEIEREIAAIRRRYTDPESHVFPAAITFLVPGAV